MKQNKSHNETERDTTNAWVVTRSDPNQEPTFEVLAAFTDEIEARNFVLAAKRDFIMDHWTHAETHAIVPEIQADWLNGEPEPQNEEEFGELFDRDFPEIEYEIHRVPFNPSVANEHISNRG